MTIKEYLSEKQPVVASVLVTVTETCFDAHPIASTKWTYSEDSLLEEKILGHLYHDSTSLRTAQFDLLKPILETLNRGILKHTGKLSPYYCGDGKTVLRNYECEITKKCD